MTFKEVKTMVESIGYPATYYEFQNAPPKKPFVVWYFPRSADFYADGLNYQKIEQLNIELYTREKDFMIEYSVDEILRSYELIYTKVETYLNDEHMYQVLYQTEVTIWDESDMD